MTKYEAGLDANQSYVNYACQCAMDGVRGFCGSVLGTKEYAAALYELKPVLEKSNCHTLDRHDFRAHKDTCGIGFGRAWKNAVE